MILYKYMSFSSAASAIQNDSIGFSCLEDLNDPFECAALCFESGNGLLTSSLQQGAYRNRLSQKYGVLSLTRTPLNALLWAHYGDDHRGVVIGIDIEKAGLNNVNECVIPAKFGEIIYTSTIPRNELPASTTEALLAVGDQATSFHVDNYDLYKNAFLYKDLSWGYEEEVRVVKNVIDPNSGSRYTSYAFENPAGKWNQIQIQGRPLCCLSIPSDAIVEAYLGCSAYANVSRLGFVESDYLAILNQWKDRCIKVKVVRRKSDSWQLEMSDFQV
ncbi:DUF2971 domain-containing protein [Neptunomonas sp.]|uniref:DUF2971 domain-containing protein n=1 Tax=Neptunomonas sp. TaxID=1971898 RepID=UPI0035621786